VVTFYKPDLLITTNVYVGSEVVTFYKPDLLITTTVYIGSEMITVTFYTVRY